LSIAIAAAAAVQCVRAAGQGAGRLPQVALVGNFALGLAVPQAVLLRAHQVVE
jgi:hypothetical protein